MASLTISGIWLLMKETTPIILFWYILENLSGIGLFRSHADLKIQTLFKTFRPCNCAACPRIASELSESAENNFFVIWLLMQNRGKEQAWVQNSDPIQKLQLCNMSRTQWYSFVSLFSNQNFYKMHDFFKLLGE